MLASAHHLRGAARAFSATFLALQSLGIVLFWVALWRFEELRPQFFPIDSPAFLFGVAVVDATVLPITGIAAAALLVWPHRFAVPLLWIHAGAAIYAGVFALGLWLADRSLWLGAGLMLPTLTAPGLIAWAATFAREGRKATAGAAIVRTGAQVVVFWLFFLLIVPRALALLEPAIGIPQIAGAASIRTLIAGSLFVLGSLLGLASAWTMALHGLGTPLPIDPAHNLVVRGPYAYVRNPMAIGGLAQGLAVAIWLGSPLVALYIVVGALLWQIAIRPAEERELARRFGDSYRRYCAQVRCWLPKSRAYVAE